MVQRITIAPQGPEFSRFVMGSLEASSSCVSISY